MPAGATADPRLPGPPAPAPHLTLVPTSTQVRLAGTAVDALTEQDVVAHIARCWERGLGGMVVTANIDILRVAQRDPVARSIVDAADLVVADGLPLRWAAQLRGLELPERVTGASLFWTLSEAVAQHHRRVFILGGPPGAAERAGGALVARYPSLVVAGTSCPPWGFDRTAEGLEALRAEVVAARPDLVLVGLGFPKQERVAVHLREALPEAWFLGCGAAIVFAAGDQARAPVWMQRSGLEWAHRLASEPRRLARRYLREDLPFSLDLLGRALLSRRRGRPGRAVPVDRGPRSAGTRR